MKLSKNDRWAKAHFFIAIRQCLLPPKKRSSRKIAEIAERVGRSGRHRDCRCRSFWAPAAAALCAFLSTGRQGAPRPSARRSHADCEFISQQVGTILDVEDVIPGDSYTLEVSSPGLERKLSQAEGLRKIRGTESKSRAAGTGGEPAPLGRQTGRNFARHRRAGAQPPARVIHFPLEQVQKANLKFEW